MELWSPNHVKTLLPSFIIMIILGIVLRIFIGKKSEKIRMIPFQICTVILLVLEVIKQVKSFADGYDLYHIPLHFCSLFLYLLPAMSFYNGKHKDKVRAVTTTVCASLFLLMTIYPSVIYSGEAIQGTFTSFWDFHTTVFHTIATFTFVLVVCLDLYKPNLKQDLIAILVFFAIYCVIAGVVSQILETNYNNFYHCNVPPLEELRTSIAASIGYSAAQTIYVIIVSIVNLIFVNLSYQLFRLLRFVTLKVEKLVSKK